MLLKRLPILLLTLYVLGCSEDQQATRNAPEEKNAPSTASAQQSPESYYLVFFLDPNGAPCRMQDRILKGMSEDLKGAVDLRYVQTTVPSDRDYFYKFGIRGLPTLLLADASGKEVRRLPPGVKSAEEIRDLLKSVSVN